MKNRFVNTLAVVGCTVSTAFAADLSNQKNDSFPMQKKVIVNGTSKATVKLKFTYDNRWGDTRKESLFLAYTKDGGSSCR